MAEIVIGGVKCMEKDGALCIVPDLGTNYGPKSIADVKAGVLSYQENIKSPAPITDTNTIGVGFSLNKLMAYVGLILEKANGKVPAAAELGLNFYLSNEGGVNALNIVPFVRQVDTLGKVDQWDFNDFDAANVPILNPTSFELMNKGNAIPPPFNNRVID
jgi:hypothetical protein